MCDKCGMTFYHNSNLKKHLETAHTGSRLMAVQPSVYPILGHPADMVSLHVRIFFIEKSKLFIVSRASASTTSMRLTAMPSSSTTTTTSTATIINTTTQHTTLDNGGSSTRTTINTVNTIKTILFKRIMGGKD